MLVLICLPFIFYFYFNCVNIWNIEIFHKNTVRRSKINIYISKIKSHMHYSYVSLKQTNHLINFEKTDKQLG